MAPPAPRTPADARRAESRAPLQLFADRIVRLTTRINRAKLLEDFEAWLIQAGYMTLKAILSWPLDRTEEISGILVSYGRSLFRAGAAYYRYSETINAVAAARPGIRRHLGSAWDLAFAWLSEEPHAHHKALPKGVLLAVLAAALSWGWLREAAVFALAWAGLLRIGEALNAYRRDLILPRDAAPGTDFVLLQISSPKTRGTLRRRFKTLQERLGLASPDGGAHFDLASFRPGGATWMLTMTENPDLVRRRGRWLSTRVMEIYLQEVQAATYLPSLSTERRAVLQQASEAFSSILAKAIFFIDSNIPQAAWYYLLSDRKSAWSKKKGVVVGY
ncbi:hypothetical protein AK812_SmicGene21 [Symbiodinium microadriaticum]|uniref:Tyr recombinase domain-containing protein n=1 Tax=Symbiodinium microadriaticum TaxID=2951 RepID=A0A1Q9F7C1_SYMMI|nr:hypothetical protein AK812_SmicGene21 [Symbiodinium microadriaticum]